MSHTEPLPIVLVPGLNCSARLYAEQIPALWQFGPVTVADHRRDDSMAAIARRILAAAPPRFALAGLSMGGYIAFEIMRQAPSAWRNWRCSIPARAPKRPSRPNGARSLIALAKQRPLCRNPRRRVSALRSSQPARRPSAQTHRAHHGRGDRRGAYLRQQQAIIGRPDSRPGLGAIACPTLVLVGDGDEATPPELAREIAGWHSRLAARRRSPTAGTCRRSNSRRRSPAALVEWMRS